jgi:hypothetical protein
LRTLTGTPVWKVPVRTAVDDWVVLWWPRGELADIYYIGPLARQRLLTAKQMLGNFSGTAGEEPGMDAVRGRP